MNNPETTLHLYQRPRYCSGDGKWYEHYLDALDHSSQRLTWDPAAILSILSFGYACGDRTLVNEIKRQPWLSKVGTEGLPQLENIPPHDTIWDTNAHIAGQLGQLLRREIVQACQGRDEIYLLLSGGLDSRIVAAVTAQARHDGEIAAKPVAVTWGCPDSRDVHYGREAARLLGIEWVYVSLTPDDLLASVEEVAKSLGGLVSPVHLHRMTWFRQVSKDALVIAASYGDSVGRAEYSKRSLLELRYLQPLNTFELMDPPLSSLAREHLQADLKNLHARTPGQSKYVLCEHEMQGHYMRGMIGHSMSIINNYCTLYQAFTHPSVFSYMWSIHPSRRTDDVYAQLLELLDPELARLPWARTNRALRGQTKKMPSDLRPSCHEYHQWIGQALFAELRSRLDLEWFSQTGIFSRQSIERVSQRVKEGAKDSRYYELFVWLVSFRRFARYLEDAGRTVELGANPLGFSPAASSQNVPPERVSKVRIWARNIGVFHNLVSRTRRSVLRLYALRQYPRNYAGCHTNTAASVPAEKKRGPVV
jgi:asparagine synthase (glutamine-hydrolysing)